MLLVLVLASLAATCFAQVPTRCDSPKQWECRRLYWDRTRNFREFSWHVYDETNRRTRSVEEIEVGSEKDYFDVLHLHNEGKEYRVNLRTKKCNVTAITRPFRPVGIIPGSRFIFESVVGASNLPNEHFTAVMWDGKFPDGAMYMMSVTTPDCIPLTFDVRSNTTSEHFAARFYDFHIGITDPMAFLPPRECA